MSAKINEIKNDFYCNIHHAIYNDPKIVTTKTDKEYLRQIIDIVENGHLNEDLCNDEMISRTELAVLTCLHFGYDSFNDKFSISKVKNKRALIKNLNSLYRHDILISPHELTIITRLLKKINNSLITDNNKPRNVKYLDDIYFDLEFLIFRYKKKKKKKTIKKDISNKLKENNLEYIKIENSLHDNKKQMLCDITDLIRLSRSNMMSKEEIMKFLSNTFFEYSYVTFMRISEIKRFSIGETNAFYIEDHDIMIQDDINVLPFCIDIYLNNRRYTSLVHYKNHIYLVEDLSFMDKPKFCQCCGNVISKYQRHDYKRELCNTCFIANKKIKDIIKKEVKVITNE